MLNFLRLFRIYDIIIKFFILTVLLSITSCATQTHNRSEPREVTEALEAIWGTEVNEFINKSVLQNA